MKEGLAHKKGQMLLYQVALHEVVLHQIVVVGKSNILVVVLTLISFFVDPFAAS